DATATDNTVGGTAGGSANVISANAVGVEIRGSVTGNVVVGNRIGTDVTGTAALGNTVGLQLDGAGDTIDETTAPARNTIAGTVASTAAGGGGESRASATGNVVVGNRIGTDVNGTAALGNDTDGVRIGGGSDNTIGGTAAGEGNVISGNAFYGVDFTGSGTNRN